MSKNTETLWQNTPHAAAIDAYLKRNPEDEAIIRGRFERMKASAEGDGKQFDASRTAEEVYKSFAMEKPIPDQAPDTPQAFEQTNAPTAQRVADAEASGTPFAAPAAPSTTTIQADTREASNALSGTPAHNSINPLAMLLLKEGANAARMGAGQQIVRSPMGLDGAAKLGATYSRVEDNIVALAAKTMFNGDEELARKYIVGERGLDAFGPERYQIDKLRNKFGNLQQDAQQFTRDVVETRPRTWAEMDRRSGEWQNAMMGRFANSWAVSAPDFARNAVRGRGPVPEEFPWEKKGGFGYYDETDPWNQMFGGIGSTLGLFSPKGLYRAAKWTSEISGIAPLTRVVGEVSGISKGLRAIKETKIGQAVTTSTKVKRTSDAASRAAGWSPAAQLMQSGQKAYKWGATKVALTPSGRAFGQVTAAMRKSQAASEASGMLGKTAVLIGGGKIKTMLKGVPKSAEDTINRAAADAAEETLGASWTAALHSPLGAAVDGATINDAAAAAQSMYAARVRVELGKVIGNVDDETMTNMVGTLTKEFGATLTANKTALGYVTNPFGTGATMMRLRSNPVGNFFTDSLARTLADGAAEAAGFGAHHLVTTYGEYFSSITEQNVYYGINGQRSLLDNMKDAADVSFKENFTKEGSGGLNDSLLSGAAFGTKMGLGLLPWFNKRNFNNLNSGLNASNGRGKMTDLDHLGIMLSEANEDVVRRAGKTLGIDVNRPVKEVIEAIKMHPNANKALGAKDVARAVKNMRGDLNTMNNKQLAWLTSMSQANAERRPIILRDGKYRRPGLNFKSRELQDLYKLDPLDPRAMAMRKRVISDLTSETNQLAGLYKNKAKWMFAEDMLRGTIMSGAIFYGSGGKAMIEAVNDGTATPGDVSQLMTHAIFSFMSGNHLKYAVNHPDAISGKLDTGRVEKEMSPWLRNRLILSQMQAQLYYQGGKTDPFIMHTSNEVVAHGLLQSAGGNTLREFLGSIGGHMDRSQKRNKVFMAVTDTRDNAAIRETGLRPITHNELDQAMKVLKALVDSGAKLPKSFSFNGLLDPTDGQKYIDDIESSPDRAEYLGHVASALRTEYIKNKYLKPGEEFTAEHFYRSVRLATQARMASVAKLFDDYATRIAKAQGGYKPGDIRLYNVRFKNRGELNAQMQDFSELVGMMHKRYSIFGVDKIGVEQEVGNLNDPDFVGKKMGKNGEIEVEKYMAQLHEELAKMGFDRNLKLGDVDGKFKNSMYNSLEATGRFMAGELFHFRNDIAMNGVDTHTLNMRGVIAAAHEAGLLTRKRVPGSGSRGENEVLVLRHLSEQYMDSLKKSNPEKHARLDFLHTALSMASKEIYTIPKELSDSMGLTITSDSSKGIDAGDAKYDLDVLFSRQNGASRTEDDYNPVYHERGLFGALEDAGVVINSVEQAKDVLADLQGLKHMGLSEELRMFWAAAKAEGMIRKTDKGWALRAPAGFLNTTATLEELRKGNVQSLSMALRVALRDRATRRSENTPEITPARGSQQFRDMRDIANEAGVKFEGDALASLWEDFFGADVDKFIALGEAARSAGIIDIWDTNSGDANGVPLSFDSKYINDRTGMPIMAEVISPLANVRAESRAKFVDAMDKQIRGFGGGRDGTTAASVEKLAGYIQRLGLAGDRRAMTQLRWLTKDIGKIVVSKDGKTVDYITVSKVTQKNMADMAQRLEALEMGSGGLAEAYNRFTDAYRDKTTSLLGNRFVDRPEQRHGVTFSDLFRRMRIGSVLSPMYHDMFREYSDQIFDKYEKTGGPVDNLEMLKEVKQSFDGLFRFFARESIDPKTTGSSVEQELLKLNDVDYMGLYEQSVGMEVVYDLTSANAANFELTLKSGIPVGDAARETLDEFGQPVVSDSANSTHADVPRTIVRADMAIKRSIRKKGIIGRTHELVGSDDIVELNIHDSTSNVNLLFEPNRLNEIAERAFNDGVQAVDETPNMDGKIGRDLTGRMIGHYNSDAPRITVMFGDNKFTMFKMPTDQAGIVKLFKAADKAFANSGESHATAKAQYDAMKASFFVDGQLKYDDMRSAIKDGALSLRDAYNMYATILRGQAHGTGIRVSNAGKKMYAMDGSVGDSDSNKRYNQLSSDSYRHLSDRGFAMAVDYAISKGIIKSIDEIPGLVKKSNGTYAFRVKVIDEGASLERNGVKGLDGNVSTSRGMMDVLAMVSGFDPANLAKTGTEMRYAGWKGFLFGESQPGFNMLTKTFFTTMDENSENLAKQLNVAMVIPMSSIKLGKPEKGSRILANGVSVPFFEAAFRAKNGEAVAHESETDGIYEFTAEALQFQSMHDPLKTKAVATGQMTQGMRNKGIKAFVEDNELFPISAMQEAVGEVSGYGISNSAASRLLIESNKSVDEKYSPDDYVWGSASLLDVIMINDPMASPNVMFDKQTKAAILSRSRDKIFKGLSEHGGSAAMRPDTANDLDTTELVIGHQSRFTLVNTKNAYMGVRRTVMLNPANENGEIQGGTDASGNVRHSREFNFDDADRHQRKTFEFEEGDRGFHYNKPSEDLQLSTVADRQTTWTDTRLLDEYSYDSDGHIRGFMGQVAAEIWGGGEYKYGDGVKNSQAKDENAGPMFQLFRSQNGHITNKNFHAVAGIVNNGFVEVMRAKNGSDAISAIDAMKASLYEKLGSAEARKIIDLLHTEMAASSSQMFSNTAAKGEYEMGRGTSAKFGSNEIGDVLNGDLFDFVNSVAGWRGADGRAQGYQHGQRYRDGKGVDITNGVGKNPVSWGLTGVLQRSPSAKINDTVLFHQLGYLQEHEGGLAAVNRKDAVDLMESDYDYDTFKYIFGLPKDTVAETVRLRSIMGALGSQKGDSKDTNYTYLVDSNPYSLDGNKYLQYMKWQARASALKGQFISVKAITEKLIADNMTMEYEKDGVTYRIRPRYNQAEMQTGGMQEMIKIYKMVQQALDAPGSMDIHGLSEKDPDAEIFNSMFIRRRVDGGVESAPIDKMGMSDFDMNVLRGVRGLIGSASSVMRDEFDGDSSSARNLDDMISIARKYVSIMGDRSGKLPYYKNVDQNMQLREYIKSTINRDNIGSNEESALGSLRITMDKNNSFIDSTNSWLVQMGDAMDGSINAGSTNPSGELAREYAGKVIGDHETLQILRSIDSIPAIRAELSKAEARSVGGDGKIFMSGELAQYRYQLEEALKAQRAFGGFIVAPDTGTPEGKALAKHLRNGTIYGYGVKLTAANIEDTMNPQSSKEADAAAELIVRQIGAMWANAMSPTAGPGTRQLKPHMVQDAANAVVANYLEQFADSSSRGDQVTELMVRLLTPKANAVYRLDRNDWISYERMPAYIVRAIMNYDQVRATDLFTDINRNVTLMSDIFSGKPVVGALGIRDQVEAIQGYDGRIGERRTMLRNVFAHIGINNPIEEIMKANATKRVKIESDSDSMFGGTLPGAKSVKSVDRTLAEAINAQLRIEDHPGDFVHIDVSAGKFSTLSIPGLYEYMSTDFEEGAKVTARTSNLDISQTALYMRIKDDIIEHETQKLSKETGRNIDWLTDDQMRKVTLETNRRMRNILGSVTGAIMQGERLADGKPLVRQQGNILSSINGSYINKQGTRNLRKARGVKFGKGAGSPDPNGLDNDIVKDRARMNSIANEVLQDTAEGALIRLGLGMATGVESNSRASLESTFKFFAEYSIGRNMESLADIEPAEINRLEGMLHESRMMARDAVRLGASILKDANGDVTALDKFGMEQLASKVNRFSPATMRLAYATRAVGARHVYDRLIQIDEAHKASVDAQSNSLAKIVKEMNLMIGKSSMKHVKDMASMDARIREVDRKYWVSKDAKQEESADVLMSELKVLKRDRAKYIADNRGAAISKAIVEMANEPDTNKRYGLLKSLNDNQNFDTVDEKRMNSLVSQIGNFYKEFVKIGEGSVDTMRSAIQREMYRRGATEEQAQEAARVIKTMGVFKDGYFTQQSILDSRTPENLSVIKTIIDGLQQADTQTPKDIIKFLSDTSTFMETRHNAIKPEDKGFNTGLIMKQYMESMLHTSYVAKSQEAMVDYLETLNRISKKYSRDDVFTFAMAADRYMDHARLKMLGTQSHGHGRELSNMVAAHTVGAKLSGIRLGGTGRNVFESEMMLWAKAGMVQANHIAMQLATDKGLSSTIEGYKKESNISLGQTDLTNIDGVMVKRKVLDLVEDPQLRAEFLTHERVWAENSMRLVDKYSKLSGRVISVGMSPWRFVENKLRERSFNIGAVMGLRKAESVMGELFENKAISIPRAIIEKYNLNADVLDGRPENESARAIEWNKVKRTEAIRAGLDVLFRAQGQYNILSRHPIEDFSVRGYEAGKTLHALRQYSDSFNTELLLSLRQAHHDVQASGMKAWKPTRMEKEVGFGMNPAMASNMATIGAIAFGRIAQVGLPVIGLRWAGVFRTDMGDVFQNFYNLVHNSTNDEKEKDEKIKSMWALMNGPHAQDIETVVNNAAVHMGIERESIPSRWQDLATFVGIHPGVDPTSAGPIPMSPALRYVSSVKDAYEFWSVNNDPKYGNVGAKNIIMFAAKSGFTPTANGKTKLDEKQRVLSEETLDKGDKQP